MPLPIQTIWKPLRTVYAVVFNTNNWEAWNEDSQEFESLGSGSACDTGEAVAIALTEDECSPGVYRGSADALVAQGTYVVVAWEQDGGTPNLIADEAVGAVQVDYDGSEEITFIDIDGALTNIQTTLNALQGQIINVEVNGGLTAWQNRMLTNIYQRKDNNQRR